jgi:hypothetical protein
MQTCASSHLDLDVTPGSGSAGSGGATVGGTRQHLVPMKNQTRLAYVV